MFARIQRLATALQRRRDRAMAIRTLSLMNDHQLADIGVERGSIVEMLDSKAQLSLHHAAR